MNIVPVIFEDHNLANMRPLSWSVPAFEIRCGIFNTRERVGLCSGGGFLLGRPFLEGLNRAADWSWGVPALADSQGGEDKFLFLNGILAPDFSLVEGLLELARWSPGFVWREGPDLMAALVDRGVAVSTAADWEAWEKEQARRGAWHDPAVTPEPWNPVEALSGVPDTGTAGPDLDHWKKLHAVGPTWIWDIVGSTPRALAMDLTYLRQGIEFRREPFGIFPRPDQPVPDWAGLCTLEDLTSRLSREALATVMVDDPGNVFCGPGVDLAAGTAIGTDRGPVILDRGVRVMPHCYLEGPLYIGPGSLIKPGARIHGESSFGIVNRLAGEIGESTFGDFANKQHEGFIGHAVLGAWTNLGAMTTCSDLKNNYGQIRVDLGAGALPTGSRFVGLMMGDHAKTAIGTLFNTGTCVGFASNIFGTGMPPKFVGNFRWGGQEGCPEYAVDRARSTAEIVMGRRGCQFTAAHRELFNLLG